MDGIALFGAKGVRSYGVQGNTTNRDRGLTKIKAGLEFLVYCW